MNKTPQLHRKPACNTHCLHAPVHVRQLICQGLSPYHTATVSHSSCVPDWRNHSLILLTWSAFLFSLKLLSDTCPGQMDPRPFQQCNTYMHTHTRTHPHTLDLRRLINPGDFSYLIPDFSLSLWQMSPQAGQEHCQARYAALKLRSTDVERSHFSGLPCRGVFSVPWGRQSSHWSSKNCFTKPKGLSDLKKRIIIKHYWGAQTSHCSVIYLNGAGLAAGATWHCSRQHWCFTVRRFLNSIPSWGLSVRSLHFLPKFVYVSVSRFILKSVFVNCQRLSCYLLGFLDVCHLYLFVSPAQSWVDGIKDEVWSGSDVDSQEVLKNPVED